MSSLVVQIFENGERAAEAVTKLQAAGFPQDAVMTVSSGSADSVPSALVAGQMMAHRAGFYAERVRQGRTLVGVVAHFGRAGIARQIMIEAGAVDRDLVPPADPNEAEYGPGAPFSEALGWRVLQHNNPTPLSDAFQIGVLARTTYFLTRSLGNPHRFLGRMFGELLGGGAAPLSSKFGLSLLSDRAAPLSSRFGLPLLSNKPPSADIASWSRNPAPLSSALGLPLLSGGR